MTFSLPSASWFAKTPYYPSNRSRSPFYTSKAHPPTLFRTWSSICSRLSIACLCLFIFIYFQAAGRLTWIAHDASDTLSSATGQETVPAHGRAPGMSTMERALPLILLLLQQAESGNARPPAWSSAAVRCLKRKLRILDRCFAKENSVWVWVDWPSATCKCWRKSSKKARILEAYWNLEIYS